jgi:AAHS family 4-hydroxybenzoate transporter-like MFS transporter
MPTAIDISRLIDERKMSSFNVKLLILSYLIVLFDGFDVTAAAFAGPSLVKAWAIPNMAALGPMFSASLLGLLLGGLVISYFADRWGRKTALIGSLLILGVFTFAAMWATNLTELSYLRVLAGLGIGGITPVIIALNAEFAPKRFRATLIIVMYTGISFGSAMPGLISAWLVPTYGWQVLFFIGGVSCILVAAIAALWLPESLKFQVLKNRRAAVVKSLAVLEPQLAVAKDATFVIGDEKTYARFTPKLLFADGFHWITPLLWVCFFCSQMSFFFVNSWLPTVLTSANISLGHAAIANTLFQIGGTIGGLAMSRPMDKMGFVPVCVYFLVAAFIASSIGYAREPEALLMIVVFFAGFFTLAIQFGVNATAGMIYPTAFRANGTGWALTIGRTGGIIGPMVASVLIGMHLAIEHIFLFLALPLTTGAIASSAMAMVYYRRFGRLVLGHHVEAAPAAVAFVDRIDPSSVEVL